VALDLADYDSRRRLLRVRHGKGRKQRTVYLSPSVNRLLAAWVKVLGRGDGPLFCPISRAGHVLPRRLRGESVGYLLRKRREEAKIPHFTAHDLRRTFISTLLDAGVDVLTVQELAGHADARTTGTYDRRGEKRKREAAGKVKLPLQPSH
jgi:integrase